MRVVVSGVGDSQTGGGGDFPQGERPSEERAGRELLVPAVGVRSDIAIEGLLGGWVLGVGVGWVSFGLVRAVLGVLGLLGL